MFYKDNEDLKVLLLRLDANCTIRNADMKKLSENIGDQQKLDKLSQHSQLKLQGGWYEKAKSTALGVVTNYEQRIQEIEKMQNAAQRTENELMSHYLHNKFHSDSPTRIPSAPLERKTGHHKLSLLSL